MISSSKVNPLTHEQCRITQQKIIVKFADQVAREQREACFKNYKKAQAENLIEKVKDANSHEFSRINIKYKNLGQLILDTPLITNQKEQ